jgi:hypothetical protein
MSKSTRSLKPWQVLILVLGVAAVGYLVYRVAFTGKGTGQLADAIYGVDVATGEVFEYDVRSHAVVFPAVNPATGKRTVLPAGQAADGTWFIEERYIELAGGLGAEPKAVTDRATGKVDTKGQPIKRVD